MSACPKCGDDKFYDLHCSRCGFDTVELLVTERDAARARVAELEREKDTDNLAWEHLLDLFRGAEAERDAARAEVERLKAERDEWKQEVENYKVTLVDLERERADHIRDERKLYGVLKNLIERLNFVHESPEYKSVWEVNQLHNGPYTGPTYTEAFEEAERVLNERQEAEDHP